MRQAPRKIPGCCVSNELPWLAVFHTCCPSSLLRESSVPPLGENYGSRHRISPRLRSMPVSLADFALYPFGIINQRHAENCMWALWVLLGCHQIIAGLRDLPTQRPRCGIQRIFTFAWNSELWLLHRLDTLRDWTDAIFLAESRQKWHEAKQVFNVVMKRPTLPNKSNKVVKTKNKSAFCSYPLKQVCFTCWCHTYYSTEFS